jgi:hypothetical protein
MMQHTNIMDVDAGDVLLYWMRGGHGRASKKPMRHPRRHRTVTKANSTAPDHAVPTTSSATAGNEFLFCFFGFWAVFYPRCEPDSGCPCIKPSSISLMGAHGHSQADNYVFEMEPVVFAFGVGTLASSR